MEKRILQLRNGLLLQHPYILLFVLILSFVAMDPFKLSPIAGRDFRPLKNDIAPFKQVMQSWPWDDKSRLGQGNLMFKNEIFGPESLEFDASGRGPYAGLADGRIVRWRGKDEGWETFALVSPKWSEKLCAQGVNSTTKKQWKVEEECGRPLGLRFDAKSGNLYIADAYFGLMVVGAEGGLATPLATHVDGEPILFANDLDIHENGSIFFTDSSMRYNRADHFFILLEGEATGRLLRYDPSSKTTHVVVEGLAFPNGVQLSKDQSFLLYTETTNCRMMKYLLKGPKTGTTEVMVNLPGFPDNVRMSERGDYWVAIDCCRTAVQEVLIHNPWMRSLYFRLPIPLRYLAKSAGTKMYTMVARLNDDGEILDVLDDRKGEVMKLVSEVRERDGILWIGTVAHNQIATVPYSF
ncbi:Calcium-dependent phosphotriesterase superfamily protein [Perilla frutescens var. hirtella]|uniref:Calcium-dependent phosphotriesterase superfamily protein n=1 Tax=Perilla frutescens var. hirtella TaxID=608512 RepID=A0AAD4JMP8_PERFH|nr:Calcium-dependent phosphotriesterase superfamily protein [Perilla frutescens var. hirtella]KAH6836675.1 Calcium-dependent phosphotriesterase superfamily protein [Perilla frutescens var. hirtella]